MKRLIWLPILIIGCSSTTGEERKMGIDDRPMLIGARDHVRVWKFEDDGCTFLISSSNYHYGGASIIHHPTCNNFQNHNFNKR